MEAQAAPRVLDRLAGCRSPWDYRPIPEPNPERQHVGTDSDVGVFGLANLLIAQGGQDAQAHATRPMEAAIRDDDPLAAADWRAVEAAIGLLSNDSAATMH